MLLFENTGATKYSVKIWISPLNSCCSYPPTPNTPGSNTPISGHGEYPGGPGMPQGNPALSAALVAAAATATATATATASMVAIQDQQQQLNMQMNMNGQYPPQMQVRTFIFSILFSALQKFIWVIWMYRKKIAVSMVRENVQMLVLNVRPSWYTILVY